MARKNKQGRTDKDKRKIVIVDDHPIVRRGLADLINHEDDLLVCGQASDAYEAMDMIEAMKPDLAIVDISLEGKSGMEAIRDIKIKHPDLPVLVLSMHDEALYAERALRAGAKGYIMKQEATEKVITAIRKVLGGQVYVSDGMAAKIVNKFAGSVRDVGASAIDRLSDRELEVFCLIGQGYGTRQIAERLHLSIKTIETYRAHIKGKLSLSSAAELLRYAVQWVSSQEQG
jgi:DNA-binding NarL/FixJ family response regulator